MINSGDVVILMNHRRLTLAIFDSSIAALIVGDVVKTTNHKSFQIFTRITLIAQETNKAVSTSEIVVVGTDQAKSTTNDPASHALASHALATHALASHALASHALASHAPAPHVPTSYAPAEKVLAASTLSASLSSPTRLCPEMLIIQALLLWHLLFGIS